MYETNHAYQNADMKSSKAIYDPPSFECNFSNCIEKSEKCRTAQLYVIVASQHSVLNAIRVKETED